MNKTTMIALEVIKLVFYSFSETRAIIDEAFNEVYYKEKLTVYEVLLCTSVDKVSLIINNTCWCVSFCVILCFSVLYFKIHYFFFWL